jgi:hypothetical protein
MAHESGLTLAQTAVPSGGENKTKEHKTALRLLEGIVLEGRLVTRDAIFCRRDLSHGVIDAQRYYLWFGKENQRTPLHDIRAAFAPSLEGAFSPSTATNLGKRAGHGDDAQQGTWSWWTSHAEGDDCVERAPELAWCRTSRTD